MISICAVSSRIYIFIRCFHSPVHGNRIFNAGFKTGCHGKFTIGRDADSNDDHTVGRDVAGAAIREAKKVFPFEFLNRFDDIITYDVLKEKHLYSILDILIAQVHHRSLLCAEPFLLEITPEAKKYLVDLGTDVQYGARPLKRVVEKEIVTPISHHICSDQIRKGDLITVDVNVDGDQTELVFHKESGVTSWEELESLGPFSDEHWAKEDLGVKDDGGEKQKIVEEITQVVATARTMSGVEE
jgi:hypothetical protein